MNIRWYLIFALCLGFLYLYPAIAQVYFALKIFSGFVEYPPNKKISYKTPFQFEAIVTLEWIDDVVWNYRTACTISRVDLKRKKMMYLVIHGDTAVYGAGSDPNTWVPHMVLEFHPPKKKSDSLTKEQEKVAGKPEASIGPTHISQDKFWSIREVQKNIENLKIRFENLNRSSALFKFEKIADTVLADWKNPKKRSDESKESKDADESEKDPDEDEDASKDPNEDKDEEEELQEQIQERLRVGNEREIIRKLFEEAQEAAKTKRNFKEHLKNVQIDFNVEGTNIPTKNAIFNHQEVVRRLKMSGAFETTLYDQIDQLKDKCFRGGIFRRDRETYDDFIVWMKRNEIFNEDTNDVEDWELISNPYEDSYDCFVSSNTRGLENRYNFRRYLVETYLTQPEYISEITKVVFDCDDEKSRKTIKDIYEVFDDELDDLDDTVELNSFWQNQVSEYTFKDKDDHRYPEGNEFPIPPMDFKEYMHNHRYKTKTTKDWKTIAGQHRKEYRMPGPQQRLLSRGQSSSASSSSGSSSY